MNHSYYRLFALFIFTTTLSFHTVADRQEATFYDNVDWAKSAPTEAHNDPNMTLNLSDFCSDDNPGCESQIRHPDEAGMSDAQITNQSTTEFYNNEQAGAIQEGFNNNSVTIDPNDETYRFSTLGIENAYEISHGQSNQYADCDSGGQCIIENRPRSCKAPTNNIIACYETPYVSKQNIKTGSVSFHYSGFTPIRYSLPQGVTEVTGINFPGVLTCQGFRCIPNNGVRFRLNGIVIHTKFFSNNFNATAAERKRCLSGGLGFYCLQKYGSFYQATGIGTSNNITIDVLNDYALFNGTFTIHYKKRENVIKWQSSCSTLLPECRQTRRTCVEGAGTRVLNGVSTYLSCWKYQIDHQCDLSNTCSSLSTDCTTTSNACSLELQGVCVEETFQKSCPEKTCSSTSLICGDTSFCLDGGCFEELPTTSDSFNENASALAALAEAADGIGDPPLIFTGKAMKCTDKAFGFSDCCKDGGWGTGIGLDQCNEEEEALGQAKEQGITISLGSYCASSFLGACTRKKKTYCVFDSKLARIIQEQGAKGQLGIGLGSAKNPICGAITPEQLQEIDFEMLDFSDFYNDMHDSTNLPSADEIQDRLQSAYGD
ncbi:type-F conjugative transfer system mating-pair stabilization protein TraN [Vibrio cyclitrophicus]|uniref:type-F conjugative transfer system mating-pair stabilization protein TraN n=1 Tax=Vibrio sp. R78045 TaxID=3093868 RepID=UPI0035521EFB